MELAGLKAKMAGHIQNTRTKCAEKSLSLMLWALDLRLWSRSLVGSSTRILYTNGHTNLEVNMQVCRPDVAAWIS